MKRALFGILTIVVLALTGCEKDFPINQNLVATKLTVNCNYDAWEPIRAYVTPSFSLSGSHAIVSVADAEVNLYQNDSLISILTYVPYGTNDTEGYYASNFIPVPGNRYTLKVKDAKYGEVDATDEMPIGATITDAQVISFPKGGTDSLLHVRLTINDASNTARYYRFNLFDTWQKVSINPDTNDTTIQDGAEGMKITDVSGISDTLRENYWTLFFTNRNFVGGKGTIDFWAPVAGSDNYSQLTLYIDLHTVSDNLYNYYRTLQLQRDANTVNSSEPVYVFSNITGGYGVFGGFDITRAQFNIK